MKRYIAFAFCILLLICLAGCGGGGNAPAPTDGPTAAPAESPAAPPTREPAGEDAAPADAFTPDFTFSARDRDGNVWTEAVFAEQKLTMINFWEPWCGPCVGEMPDLQKLSENYADKGLRIIGVYAQPDMEEEVDALLEKTGVRYLLLHYDAAFDQFQSGYVPTTIFVDGQGRVLTVDGQTLLVGSNTYEGWAAVVEGLL